MNRNMWKMIRTAQVAVIVLLLTVSCTQESNEGGGLYDKAYADITMELQPPGGYTPAATRALTSAQQNAITTATVLVYSSADQTLLYFRSGSVKANKLTVRLQTSASDLFDMVVIGNPPVGFNPTVGQTKDDLQRTLTSTITGKWAGTEFPMWGEQKGISIKPSDTNFEFKMLRSLARIDIGAGLYNEAADTWAGLANFTLTEVHVINTRTKFAVVPLPTVLDATTGKVKVTAPTIPEGTTVQGKTATDGVRYWDTDIQKGTVTSTGAYVNSTIFIAEAPIDEDRVTLIIGGTYKGVSSYYRVDMCVPKIVGEGYDYLPILRNHRYRITITDILAAGAASPELALTSPAMNIKFTLLPISESENGGEIIFDAYNYIMTDVSTVEITDNPNGTREYSFANVKAGSTPESTVTGTVTGPGINTPIILLNGVFTPVKAFIPASTGINPVVHSYTAKFGTLAKIIKVTVSPAVATIMYNPNGETPADFPNPRIQAVLAAGAKVSSIKPVSISDFLNWNTQPDGSGKSYNPGDPIVLTVGKSTVLYAQWKKNYEGIGYFGGTPDLTAGYLDRMYPKRLGLAARATQVYNTPYKTTVQLTEPLYSDPYYGKEMTIALSQAAHMADYPAMSYCIKLNKDLNKNGKIDESEIVWYLPSHNQLIVLWIFHSGLEEPFTAGGIYWSSTQAWSGSWSMNFGYGIMKNAAGREATLIESGAYVRCVRDL